MKKIIVAFLLLLILFQSGGYSCILVFQQYAIKYKMHFFEDFEKEKLQTIYLTSYQFNKCKVDDHEIKLNGKLFDIVYSEFRNGMFKLTAIHDEEEESIIDEIAIFFKYKCKTNRKLPLRANQLSLTNYIVSNVGYLNVNFLPAYSTLLVEFLKLDLLKPLATIFLPPPRF